MLAYIVDAVLIIVVLTGLIIGIMRGFVRTVAKPVCAIAAVFLAYTLAVPFAEAVVEPVIYEPVAAEVSEYMNTKCADLTVENAAGEIPTVLKLAAGLFGIDVSELASEAGADGLIDALTENLTRPVVRIIASVIAFLLLLLAFSLILRFVFFLLARMLDGGAVGILNRICGCIVSGAFGFLIAWLLALIFTFIIGLPSVSQAEWATGFSGGFFFNFLRKFNPIDFVFSF